MNKYEVKFKDGSFDEVEAEVIYTGDDSIELQNESEECPVMIINKSDYVYIKKIK